MFNTRKQNNPYEFVKMEKWCSDDCTHQGYVGYTVNGDAYLTWTQRDGIPVFSSSNRIGTVTLPEDFEAFRKLYYVLNGKCIKPMFDSSYYINNVKGEFYFSGPRHFNTSPETRRHPLFNNRLITSL